ncbi:MAG: glycosyltransferase family 1 protein [Phycisphaerales bacterium]|nr:glycosyltransferase family 1 protein [Phycisphaerales bacterium]
MTGVMANLAERANGDVASEPRVVLFTDTLVDVNGVARFIATAARHAAQTGRVLAAVTSSPLTMPGGGDVDAREGMLINVPPWWSRPMPGYPQLHLAWPARQRLWAAADAVRPSVVHVSTPGPVGLAGRAYALRRGLPLVGTYHTDFPAYIEHLFGFEPLTDVCVKYMSWFYEPFAKVLTRSAEYARRLNRLGICCSRLKRLQPGIDLEAFGTQHAPRDEGARCAFWQTYAELGVRATSIKCLYVGRVSVEKNLPMLAEAWRRVQELAMRRGIDTQLIVIGDGPYRAAMATALAGAPGGDGRAPASACFLGFRHGEELARLYAAGDVLLFPSRTDTLGQVVMEAQASGLAAIVSPEGGPREVIRPGVSGVIAPCTPEAWARATMDLLVDHHRREAMGRAGAAQMAERGFAQSFEAFWEQHRRVLAERAL